VEVALKQLLDTPTLAGKRWVYEQYDSTVQANTVLGPGGDGGLIHVHGTDYGIAAATDCNSRYVLLDPFEGGKAAVAESARNVACTGARPIGITNCLNFGNPEKPEIFFQFREACRGIAEACEALDTPVTGGNVSFYNESPLGTVDPTPVVGMIGIIENIAGAVPAHFRSPGDAVVLLGTTGGHLPGSAYWNFVLDTVGGAPPPVDLEHERALVNLLVELAGRRLVSSAHDLSDGGVALALFESCLGSPYRDESVGCTIDLTSLSTTLTASQLAFGEDHGRAIISIAKSRLSEALACAAQLGVPATTIGHVGNRGGPFEITFPNAILKIPIAELREIYLTAIPRRMDTPS
jgi:phosphoribosylformylglycinamidine synthase